MYREETGVNEANIPAAQAEEEKHTRLPGTDGNKEWPKGSCTETGKGTPQTHRK